MKLTMSHSTVTMNVTVVDKWSNKKRKRQRFTQNKKDTVNEGGKQHKTAADDGTTWASSPTSPSASPSEVGQKKIVDNNDDYYDNNNNNKKSKSTRRSGPSIKNTLLHHPPPPPPPLGKPTVRVVGKKLPLQGIVVAVSTLQNSEHQDPPSSEQKNDAATLSSSSSSSAAAAAAAAAAPASYQSLSQMCRDLGATVSGQVHKRLHCVIATPAAIHHRTQRVRKANQRSVPLVDVDWIQQCQRQNQCLDLKPFLLLLLDPSSSSSSSFSLQPSSSTTSASSSKETKKDKKSTKKQKGEEAQDDNDNTSDPVESLLMESNSSSGCWSEPVDCGCCCVCHENGTEQECPWCMGQPCCSTASIIK
jgi:hypothetical protein